jgi:hypothetical protein
MPIFPRNALGIGVSSGLRPQMTVVGALIARQRFRLKDGRISRFASIKEY